MSNAEKDAYFVKARSWDEDIHAALRASRNRAWIMAIMSMSVAVLAVLCLILMLPLKTAVPYVITLDKATGYLEVTKGLHEGMLHEDQAVTESNLVRYVHARESYLPSRDVIAKNYEFAALMSDEQALTEYQQLWNGDNPKNPSIIYGPKTNVDVIIKSVAFLNDHTAQIRFIREEKRGDLVTRSHWNAVAVYRYTQKPMRMEGRFMNPLGFKVTNYRIYQEAL
jgi:type IV secretion system protein VirB8